MIGLMCYPKVNCYNIQKSNVSFGDFKGQYKELKAKYKTSTDGIEIQTRISDLGDEAKTSKEIDCAINLITDIKSFWETDINITRDVRRIIKDSVIKQCNDTLLEIGKIATQKLIRVIK